MINRKRGIRLFYDNQNNLKRQEYIRTLQAVGSLSNLFSDSNIPNLYYRAAENVFCRTFDARNLSRSDITFDAIENSLGIALKTFQHRNGKCVEKIAEFNNLLEKFEGRPDEEIMLIISELRNDRIQLALNMTGAESMIYHLITRKNGSFEIHEEELEFINIPKLKLDKKQTTKKTIWFTDGRHEYKFSKSKSTLYKRFITANPLDTFTVDILEDPFSILLNEEANSLCLSNQSYHESYPSVILPLYSAKTGRVEEKSGLNQWNAGGRDRHKNEVYIPIPSWIHKEFKGFFPYDPHTGDKKPFTLLLPNNVELQAKICQGNGKGFMSKPNKALGKWLLRHILKIPLNTLVTKTHLEDAGIDSVVVTKLEDYKFQIDFAETGTYQEFEENNKKK